MDNLLDIRRDLLLDIHRYQFIHNLSAEVICNLLFWKRQDLYRYQHIYVWSKFPYGKWTVRENVFELQLSDIGVHICVGKNTPQNHLWDTKGFYSAEVASSFVTQNNLKLFTLVIHPSRNRNFGSNMVVELQQLTVSNTPRNVCYIWILISRDKERPWLC